MQSEIWAKIQGFSLYEVSTLGRIRNVRTNRILKLRINRDGYLDVALRRDGVYHTRTIHRLVAIAFLGYIANMDVNHIDSNRRNSILSNLEWKTHQENVQHGYDSGSHKPPYKSVMIDQTGEIFKSVTDCAIAINGNASGVSNTLKKRQKSHRGYTFSYVNRR